MVAPEVLRSYAYFQWATDDSLSTMAMVSNDVEFEAGQELFKPGEPADFMYVLTEGEVAIQYAASDGKRRTVDTLGPGDLILWSAVVDPFVATAFGVASTACKAVSIDAARLRQLMDEDGDLRNSLMTQIVKVTAARLKGAREQLARLD